jgi:hypothetical protein
MFEKEIEELKQKLIEINQKMLNANQNDAKKYINVLKKYIKLDFNHFQISTVTQHGYSVNTISFKYNGFKTNSYIPKENRLFDIVFTKETNHISNVNTSDHFDLSYNEYNETDLEFLLKRAELCLAVKTAVFKHKKEIELEFNKIMNDDNLGPTFEHEKLLNHMFNFLSNDVTLELKVDEILLNKGIKIENNIYANKFDGGVAMANELSFMKNPSGTYSITIKCSDTIVSQTSRASYQVLLDVVKQFSRHL